MVKKIFTKNGSDVHYFLTDFSEVMFKRETFLANNTCKRAIRRVHFSMALQIAVLGQKPPEQKHSFQKFYNFCF